MPLNAFQIVEGKIDNISKGKGIIYINFGQNYRTDFTLLAAPKDLIAFRQRNIDMNALAGRSVRVRGWVYERNGPAMDLTTPLQLEILD